MKFNIKNWQDKHLINESKDLKREIDFKNQDAFKKYNTKHKMRKTTKVTIGGKDTTAGDATDDKSDKNKSTQSYTAGQRIGSDHLSNILSGMDGDASGYYDDGGQTGLIDHMEKAFDKAGLFDYPDGPDGERDMGVTYQGISDAIDAYDGLENENNPDTGEKWTPEDIEADKEYFKSEMRDALEVEEESSTDGKQASGFEPSMLAKNFDSDDSEDKYFDYGDDDDDDDGDDYDDGDDDDYDDDGFTDEDKLLNGLDAFRDGLIDKDEWDDIRDDYDEDGEYSDEDGYGEEQAPKAPKAPVKPVKTKQARKDLKLATREFSIDFDDPNIQKMGNDISKAMGRGGEVAVEDFEKIAKEAAKKNAISDERFDFIMGDLKSNIFGVDESITSRSTRIQEARMYRTIQELKALEKGL